MDDALDRILDEGFLDDVSARPVAELRELRNECQVVETQLSYLRRLLQGRHDIVTGEIGRRESGGEPGEVSDLVERLPTILADRIHAPGPGRLPVGMEPGELSGRLVDRLSELSAQVPLEGLGSVDDPSLSAAASDLASLEREVSVLRRAMFDRIDVLQAEITNRYRDGQANVDELLAGDD